MADVRIAYNNVIKKCANITEISELYVLKNNARLQQNNSVNVSCHVYGFRNVARAFARIVFIVLMYPSRVVCDNNVSR